MAWGDASGRFCGRFFGRYQRGLDSPRQRPVRHRRFVGPTAQQRGWPGIATVATNGTSACSRGLGRAGPLRRPIASERRPDPRAEYGGNSLGRDKWSDIDWENSRFTVRQAKLEHHPGRATRVVPIFAALRPHLEQAYRERKPGAVYVLPRARSTGTLSTHAKRLVAKAGIEVWPKLVVNLRGRCSDDLERAGVNEKAVSAWTGNSKRIRDRHYHAVRDEDWAAATGVPKKPAPIPAPSGPISSHQEPSDLHQTREKSLDVPKTAKIKYPRQGSNL